MNIEDLYQFTEPENIDELKKEIKKKIKKRMTFINIDSLVLSLLSFLTLELSIYDWKITATIILLLFLILVDTRLFVNSIKQLNFLKELPEN